jgi:hypothetical protein
MCLALLAVVFSGMAIAEPANLQIVDTSYYLYKTLSNPSKYYYKINVTFYNSGNSTSVPVDIKLYEDGKPTVSPLDSQGVYFVQHEYRNFTFNWSTPLTYKTVNIIYRPSNVNTPATQYNSGNKTIEIGYKPPTAEKKTPGFEFSFVILVLFVAIYIKQFKMKKYN